MSKRKNPVDRDNPEWSAEDFKKAKRPDEMLTAKQLAAFKPHRGPQIAPRKVPVSIRLSANVVSYFKKTGPGWQARIDQALSGVAARGEKRSRRKKNAA